jgi:RimJ/RimL family protein N-acetyltransferase
MKPEATPYAIRAIRDEDWDSVAALINLTETYGVTGDIMRDRIKRWSQSDSRRDLVATDDDGSLVGYVNVYRKASDLPGKVTINFHVHPDASRKGLGRAFLAIGESFAKEQEANYLIAFVRERHVRGIAFADKSGFRRLQRLFESELNVTSFDARPFEPLLNHLGQAGYRFLSLADAGDTDENRRRIHALDNESDIDTPGYDNWGYRGYERYCLEEFESPGYDPSGIIVAEYDGEWVAMNSVRATPQPGIWHTEYTGVLRHHRGKGLGTCVKVLGIQNAKRSGATVLRTNNDDRNVPMLAINKELGFRPDPGFFICRKDLA